MIIVTGCSGIIVWSLLLWTESLFALQMVEVFYGTYMATEVAYYTYIYAKVDRKNYQKVTSHTRAAILIGRFLAGTLSQTLVYFSLMDYRQLNYITLGAQIAATGWAIFLPPVKNSLYFHRLEAEKLPIKSDGDEKKADHFNSDVKRAFGLLSTHFLAAYRNRRVILWSVWYAIAMCMHVLITSYIQVLWNEIDNSSEMIWNGAVEAAVTLGGATVALLAGYVHSTVLNQNRIIFVVSVLTLCKGASVILMSLTTLRWISYIGYFIFYVLYSFSITIASAEIAKHLVEDSFGLVFGINTLMGLLVQTIITIVVVSESGLALPIIEQYSVYAAFYLVLGASYLIYLLVIKVSGEQVTSESRRQSLDIDE